MSETSFSEVLVKMRQRLADMVRYNLNTPEVLQELLLQMLGECEKERQSALSQHENMQREARRFFGRAEAFNSLQSIIFGMIDTLIRRDQEEQKMAQQMEAEEQERNAAIEAERARIAAEAQEKKPKKIKQSERPGTSDE